MPELTSTLRRWLRHDGTGGVLLVAAALLALLWANSPWRDAYTALTSFRFGPAALHLDLSVAGWASDGILALFFLVIGLEIKHEVVAGSLRQIREAAVPVLAAVGGMAVPAICFAVIVLAADPAAIRGWAVPSATDIAFALAVLAMFGRGLPPALRPFLLTLAVVDDLLAVLIIAIGYTDTVHPLLLAGAVAAVAGFAVAVRLRRLRWWLLVPIGLVAWALMHASGVHATIAGVLLGLVVPARSGHGEPVAPTHRLDATIRPLATLVALPVFAFCAAGVGLLDGGGPAAMIIQPVVVAIMAGLVVGKPLGVLGVTALVTRLTGLRLAAGLALRDLLPIGLLAGLGFTVSLLLAELSYPDGAHRAGARFAVLAGSVLAAVLAAVLLRWDARRARRDSPVEATIAQ